MLRGRRRYGFTFRAGVALVALVSAGPAVHAETLEQALVLSYQNNPQLNAQRASARATDEGVAIALGGYRPRVTATGSVSQQHLVTLSRPMNATLAQTSHCTN